MHDEHELINLHDLTEVFGLESLRLKSVGVTIGSSTTHLMFSQLTVRRPDSRSSRFSVVEREVIHRSPVIFTPYLEGVRVDTERLRRFFHDVYGSADITPEDVDTGAVIITGYAARKENAGAIVKLFSRWAGKFVCETAGPNLEGMMAAHGSGAVLRSQETGKTVMNVDIGGGTSKIAVIREGRVVETSSLFVGSRVVAEDGAGRVCRTEESGSQAARELGMELKADDLLSKLQKEALAGLLTGALFELLERKALSPFTRTLLETPPLKYSGPIDMIMFSGGVAEYIYGREETDFGDLGPSLGDKIRQRLADPAWAGMLQEPEERIRATVMGAAQYSLQVSGNTIFLSGGLTLPMRNLQVVNVHLEDEKPTAGIVEAAVRSALKRYDIDCLNPANPVALALDLSPWVAIGPALLRSLTLGILSALNDQFGGSCPITLIFELDIANLVGSMIAEKTEHRRDILCLDGIEVGDLDYVDIGMEIQSSKTVPVVVKNLVFSNT